MEFKEKDRQLTILIEDEYDWLETFDASNTSNIIECDRHDGYDAQRGKDHALSL